MGRRGGAETGGRRSVRLGAGTASALLLIGALLLAPAAAPASATDTGELAQRMLRPWVERQQPDGAFPSWPGSNAGGGGGYAESVLGLALATTGRRSGDASMAAAGDRALAWALERPSATIAGRRSVFEDLALAISLQELEPRLEKGLGQRLRGHVAATPVTRQTRARYSNLALTEALRIVVAARAGAAPPAPDILRAVQVLNGPLTRYAGVYGVKSRGARTAMLSDPPANPLAYHALTLAFAARAAELLGESASTELKRAVLALAEGSAALAAPDGSVAYWGRSQEQAWALPFTAYGAQVAARLNPASADRMRGLAQRVLTRFERLHLGPGGLLLTPAMGQTAPDGDVRAGLDNYADPAAYTGLTALALSWIDPAFLAGPVAPIGGDIDGATRHSGRRSRFATVRSGARWWAIRLTSAHNRSNDPRSDFGLLAFKRQRPDGSWTDALPLRPYERLAACAENTCPTPPPTLGPAAVTSTGLAYPRGQRMTTGRAARKRWVTIRGRWETAAGAPFAPLVVTYKPVVEGIQMTWSGHVAGQGFQLGGLFDESEGPVCQAGTAVGNRGGSLRFGAIDGLTLRGGLSSATRRGITQATITLRAPSTAPVSVIYSDQPVACG